ncbi:hypothetical protein ACHAWF_011309 [Thalassiosira exigua]
MRPDSHSCHCPQSGSKAIPSRERWGHVEQEAACRGPGPRLGDPTALAAYHGRANEASWAPAGDARPSRNRGPAQRCIAHCVSLELSEPPPCVREPPEAPGPAICPSKDPDEDPSARGRSRHRPLHVLEPRLAIRARRLHGAGRRPAHVRRAVQQSVRAPRDRRDGHGAIPRRRHLERLGPRGAGARWWLLSRAKLTEHKRRQ